MNSLKKLREKYNLPEDSDDWDIADHLMYTFKEVYHLNFLRKDVIKNLDINVPLMYYQIRMLQKMKEHYKEDPIISRYLDKLLADGKYPRMAVVHAETIQEEIKKVTKPDVLEDFEFVSEYELNLIDLKLSDKHIRIWSKHTAPKEILEAFPNKPFSKDNGFEEVEGWIIYLPKRFAKDYEENKLWQLKSLDYEGEPYTYNCSNEGLILVALTQDPHEYDNDEDHEELENEGVEEKNERSDDTNQSHHENPEKVEENRAEDAPIVLAGETAAPVSTCSPVGGHAVEDVTYSVEVIGYNTEKAWPKIEAIKAVRKYTDLGLKEAKDLVDSLPQILKKGLSYQAAEELKKNLENDGVSCTIKENTNVT